MIEPGDRHLSADVLRLPKRARETLDGLLDGLGEKQIAKRLGISHHTVHTYIKQLYADFAVNSRSELLALWIGTGLKAGIMSRARHPSMDHAASIAILKAERLHLSVALAKLDREIAEREAEGRRRHQLQD